MKWLLVLFLFTVPAFAQRECANVPPNIAIAVNNERGNDTIVHETICWNPVTNTISIPSLAGVAASFTTLTGGTNTTSAFVVATGSSLTTAGAGTIVATSCPTCSGGFPVNGATAKLTQTVASQVSTDLLASAAGTGDGLNFALSFRGSTNGTLAVPVFRMLQGSGWFANPAAPLDWVWTDKANDYFGLKADATSKPGLVLGALACVDWSSSNNLGAAADMAVDTTLCRTGAQTLNFGNAINAGNVTLTGVTLAVPFSSLTSGTNTSASMLQSGTSVLGFADGTSGSPSVFFTSDGPGSAGFFKQGGVNDVIDWVDNLNAGVPLWGWTGNAITTSGLFVNAGAAGVPYFGFGDVTTGACTLCLIPLAGVTKLGVSTDDNTANAELDAAVINGGTFQTATNCAAGGTAANPSVASCVSAASGAFSCATAASTGTCTVNTTSVTANSRIFVQPSAAEGANIGVTCNTAPTLVPTILLKTKAVGSFTINMPTITVNPECFTYMVVN